MSKKWILVGLLLVPCLLVACGIPQEDYDAVVADLDAAQQEIETLEDDLASTQGMLDTTEFLLVKKSEDYSVLETQLQQTQENLAVSYEYTDNLTEELRFLRDQIEELPEFSDNLSEELRLVIYPKHFESIDEFFEWVIDNDIRAKYEDLDIDNTEMSFILQVMALRDGYLFPAIIYLEDEEIKVANQAYIGSTLYYFVYRDGALEAFIELWQKDLDLIPLYPFPLPY